MNRLPDPTATLQPDREITCRGLSCPLPVLHTRKALASLARGQILRVIATDPASRVDIVAYCRRSQTEVVALHEAAGECIFLLRKL